MATGVGGKVGWAAFFGGLPYDHVGGMGPDWGQLAEAERGRWRIVVNRVSASLLGTTGGLDAARIACQAWYADDGEMWGRIPAYETEAWERVADAVIDTATAAAVPA